MIHPISVLFIENVKLLIYFVNLLTYKNFLRLGIYLFNLCEQAQKALIYKCLFVSKLNNKNNLLAWLQQSLINNK